MQCEVKLVVHCVLKVVDKTGQGPELEDTSKVEKYEMSDADYAQRSGTNLCQCTVTFLFIFNNLFSVLAL